MANPKQRLDDLLVARGLFEDAKAAQAAILAGEVYKGMERLAHAGTLFSLDEPLEVRQRGGRFVSRGGEKLQAAIDAFGISVSEKICLDVGSSTGGFTDCLLQNGATKVVALDVGYGLLDSKLRKDPRVHLIERQNARLLRAEDLGVTGISFTTIDVSFIHLSSVLPAVVPVLEAKSEGIILFKPQFEAEKNQVHKGGVVTEEGALAALHKFEEFCKTQGYRIQNQLQSPVAGKRSGNVETLIHIAF